MGRRRVLLGAGYVVVVALVAALAWVFGVRHEGGPLAGAYGGGEICASARGSKDFAHTVASFRNDAGGDARITSITLIDNDGFLLSDAVLLQQDGTGASAGSDRVWPPASSALVWSGRQQAAGAKLPPTRDDRRWDLVLHLRSADDRAMARVGGARIDYSVGPRRYRVDTRLELVVVRTPSCSSGDAGRQPVPEQRITDDGQP